MRFPVVVAFLASIFTSVLLSHLATTTPTTHHDSSDPAAAGNDSAAANDADATAAAGDVATSSREDFSLAENPVKDLSILSRKKRFVFTAAGLAVAASIATISGLFVNTGFSVKKMIDDGHSLRNQDQILANLNDLGTKLNNLADDVQGLQTQLNDFETKLTLVLIKDELNSLKNTVDHLKQTTIDSNGKYGPSTLFGNNILINIRIHALEKALNNFNRYMTTGHPSFDQKPLVQWYFGKTGSTEKALAFKMAMIAHQMAGYEFLKILYVASCQQSNPDKPVGWCHADEAAKTTTLITNTEKFRMETQLKATNCKTTQKGEDYRGQINIIRSGKTCKAWSESSNFKPSNYPLAGLTSNYCRNPDSDPGGPWCLTVGGSWHFCDVPLCIIEMICETKNTAWNHRSKNHRYLDRHDINCGADKALQGFRMRNRSQKKINFEYKCCTLPIYCVGRTSRTGYTYNGPPKHNLFYLDRQTVDCGDHPLNRFKLETTSSQSRYYKNCLNCNRKLSCVDRSTAYTITSNGNTIYLDRQSVQCKKYEVLSKFTMQRKGDDEIRYNYRCCNFL